jgi:hypothetical protein
MMVAKVGCFVKARRATRLASFTALHESGHDAVDGSSARHVSAMDVGATKAPMIRRSYPCNPLRQSVST